jgi:hypothetical protein
VKGRREFFDRQQIENVAPKKTGPILIEHFPPFRVQELPRIE